jgi:hypothetical protein
VASGSGVSSVWRVSPEVHWQATNEQLSSAREQQNSRIPSRNPGPCRRPCGAAPCRIQQQQQRRTGAGVFRVSSCAEVHSSTKRSVTAVSLPSVDVQLVRNSRGLLGRHLPVGAALAIPDW